MVGGTFEKGGRVFERAILCGVVALAAAALLAPDAAADPPTKEPLPDTDVTGQFCKAFEVEISTTDNKEVIHVFSSGVGLITGVFKVELTNVATQETLALNISGPGKFSADGSTLNTYGTWLLFGEAGQLPGPDPGMLLVSGHSTLQLGATGITSISTRGTVTDVCALLAGT
jgi:hypothetical protein